MQIVLEKRLDASKKTKYLIPAIALFLALLFCTFLLMAVGHDPLSVYKTMFLDALSTEYGLSEIVVKFIPLAICALGISLAFRMQLWNIGAEGQFYMGAIGAGYVALYCQKLPDFLVLPVMAISSMILGGIWGGLCGFLLNKWGVNEIISTLMLNYVAILSLNFLIYGPWKDPKGMNFPITAEFSAAGLLPKFADTRVHLGIVLVIFLAFFLSVLFSRSKWGYKSKVIGLNQIAANYAGMNIPLNILGAMCISGAIAGIAGMVEVSGVVGKLQQGLSPGYGYTAIIIAWLAGLNPIRILFVALLFSIIQVGAFMVQVIGISESIAVMIQGAILFFVVGADRLSEYKLVLKTSKGRK